MLQPRPLHRAVRTRADTTGALLRVLALAAFVVAGVVIASAVAGDPTRDAQPPLPVRTAPGGDPGAGAREALVLPAARRDAR
jgi:hypothetical protein